MLRLQFDPSQPHQLEAIQSVLDLFEGFSPRPAAAMLQAEVLPNLPPYESLNEDWLADNLRRVQERNGLPAPLLPGLETEEGLVLEGAGTESWRYPSFTIEMETGTGKTYVYLRTIHELRRRYGFSKFVVVVPSIAIYEGVIKNFEITRAHFRALYGNETVHLIPYDGARLSQLRAFAASPFVEILLLTLDSFNKASNLLYKPSEKLPGEHLPLWYIQQTRPILILDEPQNMESDLARAALRTLHPLFALRYSATHRTSPNLVYRLTPFDAYRLNLVKKIQVLGVTERENLNQPFLHLLQIEPGRRLTARLRTYVLEKGRLTEAEIRLAHGDDLFEKTGREEHRAGFRVSEINAAAGFLEFENGLRLTVGQHLGPRREDLFRIQIRETLLQHMEMQERLRHKDIKVLSLFFIDRVANYTAPDGLIRRLFDEEFEKLKPRYPFYQAFHAGQVRNAYFAKKREKGGQEEAIDTASRNQAEREAEKAAFELIMKDKERLLSFEEPVCFIFAHSALKEGWDNPNVFQICTLNQTVSELKKRQEIGRGLRLAVNQRGERVFDESVNILTVVANESYERYAAALQSEYVEDGLAAPPPPTRAGKTTARRNDAIYQSSRAFRDFWAKLQKRITYEIRLDTDALIRNCTERLNNRPLPTATLVVEKGAFIITDYTLTLRSVSEQSCKLSLRKQDTRGGEDEYTLTLRPGDDLEKKAGDPRLRGYKIVEIIEAGDTSRLVFGNDQILYLGQSMRFQSESGQTPQERAALPPAEKYPLPFDLLARAARETGLTRATLLRIFQGLSDRRREALFLNPEGFASLFIGEIRNALADHIAERIHFTVQPVSPAEWGYDLDDLFPPEKTFPQKELIPGSKASLYDQVQIDSDVEKGFVEKYLNPDGEVIFYFKFPPAFKFDFPTVIGDYNPDWGIARYTPDERGGKITLELVRETKGQTDPSKLQFAHETRKITCARKLFETLGIDYRIVTDKTADWWKPGHPTPLTRLRQ
ncbi:MAG: DEAD/DEAH box helicase family protein [Anaerolineales bacterium]|nr:DEAD/DEAH box helicase family protein [Anaerolineales bacterium]